MIMKKLIIITVLLISVSYSAEDLQTFIQHHVTDSKEWHLFPFKWGHFHFPEFRNTYILPEWMPGFIKKEFSLSPTLHLAMFFLASLIMIFLFIFAYHRQSKVAPKGVTNFLEMLVIFVRDEISKAYLGEKDGRRFAPVFLTFFFLILMLNYIGLIPGMSTATANIAVTAGLASITLLIMIFGGLVYHGPINFIKLFIPSGIPVFVIPIIFPIELVGLVVKPFALTMRLFANMLAGHMVILSLLGLIITFGWFGVPAILLALFIYILELLVAFIQAYVFTMLSAMFVGSMLHPSH